MGTSSILGGQRVPNPSPGHDADALGPSDSSDSGSDIQGQRAVDPSGDSDAAGTGERSSALPDEGIEDASDILPDHIETVASESGMSEQDDDTALSPRAVHRRSAGIESIDDGGDVDAQDDAQDDSPDAP
jgi:hypothetical protein